MSLNGALQVGRSALITSQVGLQVAGDNMANAATPGFHRRTVSLAALRDEFLGSGVAIGRGVRVAAVRRQVDVALQARMRDALGQEHRALIGRSYLAALETIQNELGDNDLSSKLSTFFNSFSELANNPDDGAFRTVVIQEGVALADRIASLRGDQQRLLDQVDADLAATATRADELLSQVADLNGRIAVAEPGAGTANALRDQRDLLLDELATLIDVSVIEHPNGLTDVLVGSMPVVLGDRSRGIELRSDVVEGVSEISLRVKENGTELQVESGRLGGLLAQRDGAVSGAIEGLDTLAAALIFQVNRLHSQGQGLAGFTSIAANHAVNDAASNLNSSAAGLPWRIEDGSFFIHVTHRETGVRTTHQVAIDGDTMSLDDLVNEINNVVGVPNMTAGTGSGGTLTLDADPGFEISFSDDSSGALAALGINAFFSGENAFDIGVDAALLADPSRLAAGGGHVAGSNDTALAIAALQDAPIDALGGRSLRDDWLARVNDLAVRGRAAEDGVVAAGLVRESLGAQVAAVSGVSLDEEAIDLLTWQRQFQAAARFINVIDETLQVLLSIA